MNNATAEYDRIKSLAIAEHVLATDHAWAEFARTRRATPGPALSAYGQAIRDAGKAYDLAMAPALAGLERALAM